MRHFWKIFSYELRRNSRRRGFLFTTFGVPLIGYLLMFGVQVLGSAAGTTPIPATNNPADIAATALEQLDALGLDGVDMAGLVDETGHFTLPESMTAFMTLYPDEAAAQAALQAGVIEVYYLIPPDYFKTGDVIITMPRFTLGSISPEPARQIILSNLARDVDTGTFMRLVNPANFEIVNQTLTTAENQSENARFIIVYVFAIILMISLFLTNGYLMQSVIEEKETRLIEILISAAQPSQILGGKILALGLLGLLQLIIWVSALLIAGQITSGGSLGAVTGILATVANIQIPGSILPLLLAYFVLAYLMFAALYGTAGALSNSMREGPQYSVIFILPAVAPLWILPVFVSNPDGAIAVFLSLFPLTAPLAMTQRLVISVVPEWQVILSLVLVALGAVGAMWFAGRLFRVHTLLAGQMPKLRDFPKLLRG